MTDAPAGCIQRFRATVRATASAYSLTKYLIFRDTRSIRTVDISQGALISASQTRFTYQASTTGQEVPYMRNFGRTISATSTTRTAG